MKRTNQRLAKGSFALLMVVGTAMGQAQALPHTIQVQVDGLNQDTVYLANYYGNVYYLDTTVTDAEGRLTPWPTLRTMRQARHRHSRTKVL